MKKEKSHFSLEGDTLVLDMGIIAPVKKFARANYLVLDNFLTEEELGDLWRFTISKEKELRPSRVYKADTGTGEVDTTRRRSRVFSELGDFRALFDARVRAAAPQVFSHLGIRPFTIDHIDAQITATGNGEFFKAHTDNGHTPHKKRRISYVFYYYREPKPFTGGELRIYEPTTGDATKKKYKTITPTQNTVVFFDSGALHEVMPVRAVSDDVQASRFTLNGWIYK